MIELDCKTVLVDGCLSTFKLWIQHDVVVDVVGLLLDDSSGFKIKVWQGMARYGLGIARQSWQATWATLSSWSMRDKPFWSFETIRERTWFWAIFGWHTTGQRSTPLAKDHHLCTGRSIPVAFLVLVITLEVGPCWAPCAFSSHLFTNSSWILLPIDIYWYMAKILWKDISDISGTSEATPISVSMVSMVSLASEHFVHSFSVLGCLAEGRAIVTQQRQGCQMSTQP